MNKNLRLPEVGEFMRDAGRLVRIDDVTPPPAPPPPKKLHYIYECHTATPMILINGKVIKEYGTYNDFYGEGTCVQSAIKEAKQILKKLGPTDAEVHVVKETKYTARMPAMYGDTIIEESFYCKGVADMVAVHNESLPEPKVEIVWSSKWPQEEINES